MRNENKSPSTVGAMQGLNTEHNYYSNEHESKRKPKYFYEFERYPNASLIFLAVDYISANIIRRHHGICLLCDGIAEVYDLDFCFGREVWVLYAHPNNYVAAIQLAHIVQWAGAAKIFIILVNNQLLKGGNHER